jgi:hypothetical protein
MKRILGIVLVLTLLASPAWGWKGGGAAGNATQIQSKDIPAPEAGDDQKVIQYDHVSGDFQYVALAGGGTISGSGTPAANDIAQFTDATTIKGMTYAEIWAIAGMESAAEGVLDVADLQGFAAVLTAAEIGAAYDTEAELDALFAAKEDQLINEDGLYAALDDVDNFLQSGDTINDEDVDFDDADSNWTATTIGAALEELDNVINGGAPNDATGKVDWSQLVNVPAGFADGTDADSGGATAWDDIDNPDADDTIAAAGYELTISSTIDEAGGTVWTIDHTDTDGLTNDTWLLDLQHSNDGDTEAHFIRGLDNNTDVLWRIEYDGTAYFKSVVTDSVASPSATFYDSDAAGAAKADEDAGSLNYNFSTVTEDGEISDFWLTSFGGETAGTEYSNMFWDSSASLFYFGVFTAGASPSAVAGQEVFKIDTDTTTDNEIKIGVGLSSGANLLTLTGMGFNAGSNYTETDTDVNVTIGSEVYSHLYINNHASAITYQLPDDPETVSGVSKTFCFRNRVAQVITISPGAGDVIELDGADESASEDINNDTAEAIGDFICLQGWDDGATDRWAQWGQSGSWDGAVD